MSDQAEGSLDTPFLEDFLQDVIEVGWPNKWKNAACLAGDITADFGWSEDCYNWHHYEPRRPFGSGDANSGTWTRIGVETKGNPVWLIGCNGFDVGPYSPLFGTNVGIPYGLVFRSIRYGSDAATTHRIPGAANVFNIYPSKIDKKIYALAIMSGGGQTWFSSTDGANWANTGPPTPPKGSFTNGIPQRTALYQIGSTFAQGTELNGNPCEVSIDYTPVDFLGVFGGGEGLGVPFQVTRIVGKLGTSGKKKVIVSITSSIVYLPFLPITCVSDSKQTFVLGGWGPGSINDFDYPGCVAYSRDAGLTWFGINRVTGFPIHTIACGPRPKGDGDAGVLGTANPPGLGVTGGQFSTL